MVALFTIQVSCATIAAAAEQRSSGTGSGFFITPDGFFLTSYHVIDGAKRVQIRSGEKVSDAKLVSRDPANDIAVLKTEGHFPCLTVGLANRVKIGDDVFTVGFPAPDLQGVAPKLTKGNISATTGLRDDPRFFQISIPVQPGNSGGPLIDERGNAVGIIASTLSPAIALSNGFIPQNVNYAVKTTYAMPLVETIAGIKDKLPSIDAFTLKSISQIREEAASAVGLVMVYKQNREEAEVSRPKPEAESTPRSTERLTPEAIITKLKDLERSWEASIINHDPSVAKSVLRYDYTAITASGKINDKGATIAAIANDTDDYEVARTENLNVRLIGETKAIVTGLAREEGRDTKRRPFKRLYSFTDTWEERSGQWQCVASRAQFVSKR